MLMFYNNTGGDFTFPYLIRQRIDNYQLYETNYIIIYAGHAMRYGQHGTR